MMYSFDLEDIIRIFLKAIILSFIFAILLVLLTYLIKLNIYVAYYISDILNIPRDASITTMSFGFANNIIFLITVLECGLCTRLFYKIINTSTYEDIKDFIVNL